MRIPIEGVGDVPTRYEFQGDAEWWRGFAAPGVEPPEGLCDSLRVRLEAHRMGEDLFLDGSLGGELRLECSRCLARYRHALSEPFRLVLEPAGARRPADPEGAEALARDGLWLGDDLDAGWFDGPRIDLGAFAMELVTLALPVQPLCRDDCAGLCPRCGSDRNEGDCGCAELPKDSPFAALRHLRGGGGP